MIRINEAILHARRNGIAVTKKMLAARMWPDTDAHTAAVNMSKLCSGKTLRVRYDWVHIICEMCNVSPNFLFNYNE